MAVSYKDYYALLDVDRKADADTIARSYKKLAKKYHPDLNPGDKNAEEKFKEINEAYEVLKDPKKRQLYDQLGPNWQQGQQFDGFGNFGNFGGFNGKNVRFTFRNGRGGADGAGGSGFSDFFEAMFGGGGAGGFGGDPFGGRTGGFARSPRRGSDINVNMELTLNEVQSGGDRKLTLNLDGRTQTYNVAIPKGIKNGGKLRLAGKGRPGPAGSGDMLITIRYKEHPDFKVDGKDLSCEVKVAPWEAVLGGPIQVPTLDGPVEMVLPAHSNNGRGFRLRGRGLGPDGKRGDLIARISVQIPAQSSDEELALWLRLAELSTFRPRG